MAVVVATDGTGTGVVGAAAAVGVGGVVAAFVTGAGSRREVAGGGVSTVDNVGVTGTPVDDESCLATLFALRSAR